MRCHAERTALSSKLAAALDEIDPVDRAGPGFADAADVEAVRHLLTGREEANGWKCPALPAC